MTAKFVFEEGWRFIQRNPDLIYKGAPLALAAYFISPMIVTAWVWLPWIWVTYDIARRVPPEWINGTYTSVRDYLAQRRAELEKSK